MLQYEFMQKAFFVGILLSIMVPCIGSFLVLKRLSMMGDALSHASLSGIAVGFLIGINPLLGAFFACVIAAMSIEVLRKRIEKYSEISIAIITSLGIGLAGVLSSFIKNTTSFNSFLFGSIVAISNSEVKLIFIIFLVVTLTFIALYKELFYIIFDEEGAIISGIKVNLINFIMSILVGITIAVSARTVGALMISSYIVIPIAASMQISRSFKSTIIIAIIYALFSTILGLVLSYYFSLRPGGTIVVILVICFFINMSIKKIGSF